jgi:Protein kinase domain
MEGGERTPHGRRASMSWEDETGALIGARLGSCVLERPIGSGGMGTVFLALQERPRRQVAVKVLHPASAVDQRSWATFVERFRREADATAALDHANIVPVYEFGERESITYLVMPYLADGSLDALLARTGPLSLRRALAYLAQTASALDYAHAHGIVHRDVKPSNLLLHADGRVLLTDFGIARLFVAGEPLITSQAGGEVDWHAPADAALTQVGMLLGTPHYIAPEQIRGEPAGAAADVYALGALGYTLLAGRPPFEGETTLEVIRRQMIEPPPSLAAVRPDLPPSLDRVLAWALDRDPSRRPEHASRFVAALDEAARSAQSTPGRMPAAPAAFAPAPRPMTPGYALATELDAPAVPPWPVQTPAPPRGTTRRHGCGWRAGCAATAALCLLAVCTLGVLATRLPQRTNAPIARATATPSPTSTPMPTPSPTPVVNWLSAAPTRIELGCSDATHTATLTLTDLGPGATWWVASAPFGALAINPVLGLIHPGEHVTITVTNTTYALFGPSRSGVITLAPNDKAAGAKAEVSFTTLAC